MNKQAHKEMMQQFAHQSGVDWIKNLIEMHQRQVRELERYLEQYKTCVVNEQSSTPDSRCPSTTDVLSWVTNATVSYIPCNARFDLLPNMAAAIVAANNYRA